MVSGGVGAGSGGTGELTARKVKHLVADLDEKLSDRGGAGGSDRRDVEEGGSGSGSSQEDEESASDTEVDQLARRPPRGGAAHGLPQHRSDSRFE